MANDQTPQEPPEPEPPDDQTRELPPEPDATEALPAAWAGRAQVRPPQPPGDHELGTTQQWAGPEEPGRRWWLPILVGLLGLVLLGVLGVGIWLIARALSGDGDPAPTPSTTPPTATSSPSGSPATSAPPTRSPSPPPTTESPPPPPPTTGPPPTSAPPTSSAPTPTPTASPTGERDQRR